MKDGLLQNPVDGHPTRVAWMPVLPHQPPSLVAAILDGLILGCLIAVTSIVLFGGIRFHIGSSAISINSIWRVAVALGVLGVARYSWASTPSVVVRARQRATAVRMWFRSPAARAVLPVWAATRIGVVAVGFLALTTVGLPTAAVNVPRVSDPLLNMAYRWDTGWYLGIAVDGYVWFPNAPQRQQSIAFFPAYPSLMRIGGALLGARPRPPVPGPAAVQRAWTRTLAAGWLIALGASAAALCALHRWSARTVGRAAAGRTVVLLAAFPFAVYYSAAYTESLYLLGTVSAFNAMLDRRASGVAFWGGLVGLTRPNGFLLTVPLLLLAARRGEHRVRLGLAALLPCAGMLAFSVYARALTGDPFAWIKAHAAWGRTLPTWDGVVTQRMGEVAHHGALGYAGTVPLDVLNGAAVLLALGLTPLVWRRLGAPAAIFVLLNMIPPLVAGGLMSMGRLTATMFPVFTALAVAIPRRHLVAWAVAFAVLQGLAAALFFTWRPLL